MGVGRGDTVAFYMENSAQQAISSFAVNTLGGIWSPANIDYRGEWLASNLNDIASDVLVVDAHLLPLVNELSDVSFKHVIVNGPADVPVTEGATHHQLASLDEYSEFSGQLNSGIGDTTAVLWTSGTTGKSKGVMQSNHSWLMWSRRHNEVFRAGIREGERFYGCTPMYNSGGWIMNIYPALVSGSATCIDKKFSVSNFWDRLRFYDANHAMLLGTMHLYLWNAPAAADDADNPIRTMMMNPVIPEILEPFMERFGIERVFGGFGQSEVMGATTYHSDMPGLKSGSCGYVRDGDVVQTTLLDDDDRPVPVGEVGEICVRPNEPYALYSGYFNQPEETLKAWRNMWHHTGTSAASTKTVSCSSSTARRTRCGTRDEIRRPSRSNTLRASIPRWPKSPPWASRSRTSRARRSSRSASSPKRASTSILSSSANSWMRRRPTSSCPATSRYSTPCP